jgi:hypothetical protein
MSGGGAVGRDRPAPGRYHMSDLAELSSSDVHSLAADATPERAWDAVVQVMRAAGPEAHRHGAAPGVFREHQVVKGRNRG